MKRVYIPLEVSQRETDSSFLHASIFASLGCKVFIIHAWTFSQLLQENLLKPGLVIDKDISHRAYRQRIKPAKSQGFIYAAKDAEDLDFAMDWYLKLRTDKRSLNALDFYFYSFEDEKIKSSNVFESFELSGNGPKLLGVTEPRVLLLQKEFEECYSNFANSAKEIYGNYLFTTLSDMPTEGMSKEIQEDYIKEEYKFFEGSLLSKEEVDKFILYNHKLGSVISEQNFKLINSLYQIAENFPEKTVIVRPHPARRDYGLKGLDKLFSFKNVEISLHGSFESWFHGCQKHITAPCTTALCSNLALQNKTLALFDNNALLNETIFSSRICKSEFLFEEIENNISKTNADLNHFKNIITLKQSLNNYHFLINEIPESNEISDFVDNYTTPWPVSHKFLGFKSNKKNYYLNFIQKCSSSFFKSNKIAINKIAKLKIKLPNKDIMIISPED